ncbi:MAG: thiamine diphosphokinase [Spirochaetota bacterium]
MKRCAIVCNGDVTDYSWLAAMLREHCTVLAADGGLVHCRKAGVTPELVLGDMDSLFEETAVKKIVFPAEKNESDMELAVGYALQNGFNQIDVYGALGGRVDHQLCNIMVCARYPGLLTIIDSNYIITALSSGQNTRQEGKKGDIVTLIALEESGRCYTEGLLYPLCDEILIRGSRGLSNIMTGDVFSVSVSGGTVLIIHLKGES